MAGPPTSRARKRRSRDENCEPSETQRRVHHIMRMMSTGQWITGHSHMELADKWGISPSRVANIAGEASRWLVDKTQSDEELLAMCKATLATITKVSMSRGEMRTATEAIKPLLQSVMAKTATQGRSETERAILEFLGPDGERVG